MCADLAVRGLVLAKLDRLDRHGHGTLVDWVDYVQGFLVLRRSSLALESFALVTGFIMLIVDLPRGVFRVRGVDVSENTGDETDFTDA